MSVYDMIGRIESGMGSVEATSLDSHGNEVEVMEMDLRYFHGPDSKELRNGSEELGDYVIDCIYQKVEDDVFEENDKLSKVYDKAKPHLDVHERIVLHDACCDSVHAMYDRYVAKIAQLDAELS